MRGRPNAWPVAFTPEMGTVTLCRKHADDGNLQGYCLGVHEGETGNELP